jgi:hypothetical protein
MPSSPSSIRAVTMNMKGMKSLAISHGSDSKETLRSLRVGVLKEISERSSLDVEITASRTHGSYVSDLDDMYEAMRIYPDSSTLTQRESTQGIRIDPLDKDVIEGNLFVHRDSERGRTSFRLSIFSGDAVSGRREDRLLTKDGLPESSTRKEIHTRAGWTGGLLGMGGNREARGGTLSLVWGGFYGFMRAHNFETKEEEAIDSSTSLLTTVKGDRWDSHFGQVNLGLEYDITPSFAAILGGRATGVFENGDWERMSLAEADEFSESTETGGVYRNFILNTGITGGANVRLSDWMTLSLSTPDLASLSLWHFESLIIF